MKCACYLRYEPTTGLDVATLWCQVSRSVHCAMHSLNGHYVIWQIFAIFGFVLYFVDVNTRMYKCIVMFLRF